MADDALDLIDLIGCPYDVFPLRLFFCLWGWHILGKNHQLVPNFDSKGIATFKKLDISELLSLVAIATNAACLFTSYVRLEDTILLLSKYI